MYVFLFLFDTISRKSVLLFDLTHMNWDTNTGKYSLSPAEKPITKRNIYPFKLSGLRILRTLLKRTHIMYLLFTTKLTSMQLFHNRTSDPHLFHRQTPANSILKVTVWNVYKSSNIHQSTLFPAISHCKLEKLPEYFHCDWQVLNVIEQDKIDINSWISQEIWIENYDMPSAKFHIWFTTFSVAIHTRNTQ